ncbi:MAG: hypothetical protein ACYCX4_14485 [Bacillota bacterium]
MVALVAKPVIGLLLAALIAVGGLGRLSGGSKDPHILWVEEKGGKIVGEIKDQGKEFDFEATIDKVIKPGLTRITITNQNGIVQAEYKNGVESGKTSQAKKALKYIKGWVLKKLAD